MLSLTIYPKSTYVSNSKENRSFYYRNTLLTGNSICNDITYISLLKLTNIKLDDIRIINASLNIHLVDGCKTSLEEIIQNLILYKITENFNIKSVSWENYPEANILNLDKCDYSYNSNIISFNISSIFNNILDFKESVYGIAIACRDNCEASLYKFYSSNNLKSPFININYDKCENNLDKKIEVIFKEQEFNIESLESEFYSEPLNISTFNTATYFIKNLSDVTVYVQLQISPDGVNFTNDIIDSYIESGESIALSLVKFLKFTRIKFNNKSINPDSHLQIWLQGQTFDYYIK